MTTLRRARNGDWFSRKRIPEDIREAYHSAFKVRQEERFRVPGSLPSERAKQTFRDWDAEITSRFEGLRTKARGEGETLTQRQVRALTGDWYLWFVAQHEEEPGQPEDWDIVVETYETSLTKFNRADDDESPRTPVERRSVHRALERLGDIEAFLNERGMMLTEDTRGSFLDAVEDEFVPALALLRRRAGGDYTRDDGPQKFPTSVAPQGGPALESNEPRTPPQGIKPSGLTVWGLFEAWVTAKKPASSTVNRWRSVFSSLRESFGERDLATITPEEAQGWLDGLRTEDRSARVIHDVWLSASKTVFKWAAGRKMLTTSPFADAAVDLPKNPTKLREREFNEDECRTILRATLEPSPRRMDRHNADARRWVPWLCAYTGARPGEMTQLRAEDVKQHKDGFWIARLTPEAGAVKGNKAREVPLHQHLIEQGFVSFAQSRRKGPLFYDPQGRRKTGEGDLTNPTRPPWVKQRDKLAEWVRSLGVTDPGISPNHAWRHTFKRRAARAGIERRIRFGMCGHSSKEEGDNYETPTVEDLAAEIGKFPTYRI